MEVSYFVPPETTLHKIDVNRSTTIREFLALVNGQHRRRDLAVVMQGETEVTLNDDVTDWYDSAVPFAVTTTAVAASAAAAAAAAVTSTPLTGSFPPVLSEGMDPPLVDESMAGSLEMEVQTIPDSPDGEIRVFASTTYDSLVRGSTDFGLHDNMTLAQTTAVVRTRLHLSADLDVHLFLPTGVRFTALHNGTPHTLRHLFGALSNARRRVYAVVMRQMNGDWLTSPVHELVNCSNTRMRMLLSPLCDATPVGLTRIACLLGYLQSGGTGGGDFLDRIISYTDFAPLICGLKRVTEQPDIDGLTVAVVCATLHRIFTFLLPRNVHPQQVFDHALECSCWITHMRIDAVDPDCVHAIDADRVGLPFQRYLNATGQADPFYCYEPDSSYHPNASRVRLLEPIKELNAFQGQFKTRYVTFKPQRPLSARRAPAPLILQFPGNQVALYISPAADPTFLRAKTPMDGLIVQIDTEVLAGKVNETSPDLLINPEDVKEAIAVCLDVSMSMNFQLDGRGGVGEKVGRPPTRYHLAHQYLVSFMNRIYGFRVPCLVGLVTFAQEVRTMADFSPMSSDFDRPFRDGLINVTGDSRLWDGVDHSLQNLLDISNETYPNLKYRRILVFSDGKDTASRTNKVDLCRRLVEANVIVDAFHINSSQGDRISEDLTRMSVATGGYWFRLEDPLTGLRIFEKDSFLALSYRRPQPVAVPEDFDAIEPAPQELENMDLTRVTKTQTALSTPNWVLAEARNRRTLAGPKSKMKRILEELGDVAKKAEPSISVFIVGNEITEWKAFIVGPNGTWYERHCWRLGILFPDLYPQEPPQFRFSGGSIPWHMNVSEDGIVCIDAITDQYIPGKPVWELLLGVRAMFERPQPYFAVSFEKMYRYFQDKPAYEEAALHSGDDVLPDMNAWIQTGKIKLRDLPRQAKVLVAAAPPPSGPSRPCGKPRDLRPSRLGLRKDFTF
jgi:ubiquitin-protein ligase